MKILPILLLILLSCTTKEPEVQTGADSLHLDFNPDSVKWYNSKDSVGIYPTIKPN